METLALFVLGPVVILTLLSVLSVLGCRRLHHGRLQRLQEFDPEQDAIDGLITSNVGDSTLAVRRKDLYEFVCKYFIERTLMTSVSPPLPSQGAVGPLLYVRQWFRPAFPGPENCGQTDQPDGVCRCVETQQLDQPDGVCRYVERQQLDQPAGVCRYIESQHI